MSDDFDFLGRLRGQLQYAIQWLPKGSIGPMQVRPSATVGQVLTTTANGAEWQSSPAGVTDHGLLSGLADDDHPQYHNDARGDARYWQLSTDLATQAEFDTHKSSSDHDGRYYTETEVDTALGLKAPLASPTFTGTPSLPTGTTGVTQAENDASTKLSTTAYVDRATGNASINRPVGRAALTSAQSIGHNSWTAISFTSELTDTDSMVDIAGQPTRITCVTPGTYVVSGHVNVVGNATGRQGSRIVHKNSAGTVQGYYCAQVQENVSGGAESPGTSAAVVLAAGDYVQLECYQSSGGSLNTAVFSSTNHAELHAAWVGGTGAAWGNAGASAYKTATNHTSTGNWQAVTWETELWDIDGMHAASASTFVCTVAGKYLVTANVNFASNTTGRRLARINKNSGASYHGYAEKDPVTGDITPVVVSGVVDLSVGDTITIDAFQSSGGNLAYAVGAATSGSSQVSAVRVGYQTNPADLPGTYIASMYAANSGAPTHTSSGGWQKVGSGGGTITWTSEIDKRPSGVSAQVDTATNKRIDIRKTGLYRVGYSVAFSALADGKTFSPAVYKNGALIIEHNQRIGSAGTPISNGSRIVSLTSGDYLELYAWQDDSASEAYHVANSSDTYLQAEYLGPAT